MNRERLPYRKFLRELSFFAGGTGFLLVCFDGIVYRALLPNMPWWARLCVGALGLALVYASFAIGKYNRQLGNQEPMPAAAAKSAGRE